MKNTKIKPKRFKQRHIEYKRVLRMLKEVLSSFSNGLERYNLELHSIRGTAEEDVKTIRTIQIQMYDALNIMIQSEIECCFKEERSLGNQFHVLNDDLDNQIAILQAYKKLNELAIYIKNNYVGHEQTFEYSFDIPKDLSIDSKVHLVEKETKKSVFPMGYVPFKAVVTLPDETTHVLDQTKGNLYSYIRLHPISTFKKLQIYYR